MLNLNWLCCNDCVMVKLLEKVVHCSDALVRRINGAVFIHSNQSQRHIINKKNYNAEDSKACEEECDDADVEDLIEVNIRSAVFMRSLPEAEEEREEMRDCKGEEEREQREQRERKRISEKRREAEMKEREETLRKEKKKFSRTEETSYSSRR